MDVADVSAAVAEEDILRADIYDTLGSLLARPPSTELLARVAALHGTDDPLGRSVASLARLAGRMSPQAVRR